MSKPTFPREEPLFTISPEDFEVPRFLRAARVLASDALLDAWKARYRHPFKARRQYQRYERLSWLCFAEDGNRPLRFWQRFRLADAREVAAYLDRVDESGEDWETLVESIDAKLATE